MPPDGTKRGLERGNERSLDVAAVSEALAKQNDFVKAILNASVDLIAMFDLETRFVVFNRQCELTYGLKREEVIGKKFLEVFPLKSAGKPYEDLLTAISGQTVHHTDYASPVTGKHYEAFWVPIKRENGEVYGALGMAHDITAIVEASREVERANEELRKLNQQLRLNEERYYRMTNEVEDYAIVLLSVDGRVENWNKGAEKIKGFTADEIIGKHFSIFYTKEDQELKLPEKLLATAAIEGKATYEGWRVRKDGSRFWGSVVITALHDADNNIFGFSKVLRDLTERKMAEDKLQMFAEELLQKNRELERSNKELTSFSYVASHDLQEPLRKIQSFGNLILNAEARNLSDTGKDYFGRMINAAARMQRLIDSLLEFSRTTVNEKNFEQVDLGELLEDVKRDLREVINESGAVVISGPLPVANVIPFQFRQLLSNLLGNAIKYAKKGVIPLIDISATRVGKEEIPQSSSILTDQDYYRITVRDNGIGFEQEYAELIFELFQRLHGKTEYVGSGIGLAICKKIAENHNGWIAAESEPGVGSSFHFYLPATNDVKQQSALPSL